MPASPSALKSAFSDLGLGKRLVLVHASHALDADELLATLLETTRGFITPAFTPKALLPLDFHPSNYKADMRSAAESFQHSMPADDAFGPFPEIVRKHSRSKRSLHPALSFIGLHADMLIQSQTLQDAYAPIAALAEKDGVILLVGVDQRLNFSIHYGEKLAGRMQFIRWALTESGVVECPHFPGDSEGFNAISQSIKSFTLHIELDGLAIQVMPVKDLLRTVVNTIHEDPYSLLCGRPDCERCVAVRWG